MAKEKKNELLNEIEKLKKDYYEEFINKNSNIHTKMHNYFEKLYIRIFALDIICYILTSNLEEFTQKIDIVKQDKDIIVFYDFILKRISSSLMDAMSEYKKYEFLYENLF